MGQVFIIDRTKRVAVRIQPPCILYTLSGILMKNKKMGIGNTNLKRKIFWGERRGNRGGTAVEPGRFIMGEKSVKGRTNFKEAKEHGI